MTSQCTRRSLLAGATAAAVLAPATPALALVQERFQTLMRRVMGLSWVGQSRTGNERFEGEELVTALGMKFDLRPDWSFEGAMIEILNYNSTTYRGLFRITGECWTIGEQAGLSIYRSELVERDRLPDGLAWSSYRGELKFYNDSSREGHFTLKGILIDDVDRSEYRVRLVDGSPD